MSLNESYLEYSDDFASILNDIYKNRIKVCQMEKFINMRVKSVFTENIDPKIVDSLITSVRDNLPLMEKYLKLKTNYLGIETPHLYDYGVSVDLKEIKNYPIEEGINIIKESLKPLGSKYIEVVDKVINNGHIDVIIDEKKHQRITFSWSTYSFMIYRDSYGDLKNLIHEIGHIVNAYLSKSQPFIYEDSTVFVGELSSLLNELLLNKYLFNTSKTKEEKIFYLIKNIENYFGQVFKQTMYTEFEDILYNRVLNGEQLTVDILNFEYGKLLQKYYGNQTNYDDCSMIEWSRLGHLYRWNYYVYKYATGLIMASSVMVKMFEHQSLPLEKYLDFLMSGSNDYSLNLLKQLEVDLTNSDIINDSFKLLNKNIELLEELLECKK